jgi:hypothetical protein
MSFNSTAGAAKNGKGPELGPELNCPCGRTTDLKVVNRNAMLVECTGHHPQPCPYAVVFGGGVYCGYYLKLDTGGAALRETGKDWIA